MKTWLFNPFKFIAGSKALVLGIAAMLITAGICLLLNVHLDGVIDVHQGKATASYLYFIEPLIDWACLVIPLYVFGRILSVSSIRFIDVAGTSALARYPMFFAVALFLFSPTKITDSQKLMDTLQSDHHLAVQLLILALFTIPFLVWTVALMYNAYSVSANLKGPKAVWSFIGSFVIAEVLSKVIIGFLV